MGYDGTNTGTISRNKAVFTRPKRKGKTSNRKLLNRIWSVAEQGCQWRGLPSRFGNWPTIYTRMNRGAKTGVLNGRFEAWPAKKIIPVRIEGY
jgi:transposase